MSCLNGFIILHTTNKQIKLNVEEIIKLSEDAFKNDSSNNDFSNDETLIENVKSIFIFNYYYLN